MAGFKLLILQIGTILIVARLVGWLFGKLHQPRVIGEMVAGIMLGPSLLGWLAPGLSAALFPPDSLGYLNALSQVGLLLFMFLVGLELDLDTLARTGSRRGDHQPDQHHRAVYPGLPACDLSLSEVLRSEASISPALRCSWSIAMSITAFPGPGAHFDGAEHAAQQGGVSSDYLRRRR